MEQQQQLQFEQKEMFESRRRRSLNVPFVNDVETLLRNKSPSIKNILSSSQTSSQRYSFFTPSLAKKLEFAMRAAVATILSAVTLPFLQKIMPLNFLTIVIAMHVGTTLGSSFVIVGDFVLAGLYSVPVSLVLVYSFDHGHPYRLLGMVAATYWIAWKQNLAPITRRWAWSLVILAVLGKPYDPVQSWKTPLFTYLN